MKYGAGEIGRVFVIRLEDGDRLPESIEAFAREKGVRHGFCLLVGGLKAGNLVVGPADPSARPVDPMLLPFNAVHEVSGVGTLFPDETGRPRLHLHAAIGRGDRSAVGCLRPGVEVWQLGEVILVEILRSRARRLKDPETGFEMLEPGGEKVP
ncbi:MAG TPA: DNA-binding protein [bacterium]|nr:DNA-binding protein [bacterium]HNS47914.1 DNA-binding protein [bacterium]